MFPAKNMCVSTILAMADVHLAPVLTSEVDGGLALAVGPQIWSFFTAFEWAVVRHTDSADSCCLEMCHALS